MTKDELTQANKDDIALVAKHEDRAMGFMMFKVSEQELLDARNAVIKRMFELREPGQSLAGYTSEKNIALLDNDLLSRIEHAMTFYDKCCAREHISVEEQGIVRALRDAAMDVCNNARAMEQPDCYSVSATLIHNLQFLLTGM